MPKVKNSLIDLARVSKLGFGMHDNIIITRLDIEDRKRQGTPEKKMLYIMFAAIDPETKKRKAEIELSWFKLDPVSDYFFQSLRELCVQLAGILSSFMDKDEALDKMDSKIFGAFSYKEITELENHKWKKSDVDTVTQEIKAIFSELLLPYINDFDNLIRLKITTDNKGEYVNIPKFGIFTENMKLETSVLKFSDYELRNHSKAGIGINGSSGVEKSL